MSHGKRWIALWSGLSALSLVGCGRSSHDSGAGAATGGHAGSEPAAAGGGVFQGGAPSGGDGGSTPSPTGGGGADGGGAKAGQSGMGGTVANGGTGGNGGNGGDGAAGTAVAGAGLAGTAGSSAGDGGLAGAPSGEPGIVCGALDHTLPDLACVPGEVCVYCRDTETSWSVHCAPHPVARPAAYETFVATCTEPTLSTECDGPEDCPDGTLCQLRDDDDYDYAACSPEPPSCDAYCLACNSSADCADGQSCVPNELGVGSWLGATCGPPLNELLTRGDWIIGWSGGAIHYSWFRFTASDTNPDQGTARALPVTCTGCDALSCQGDGGTYTVMGDEVLLEFPGSCSFSFRLGNIASPAEPLNGFGADSGLEAIVSADVFVGEGLGALYEALLYAPGVACDADFTTCAFPPP